MELFVFLVADVRIWNGILMADEAIELIMRQRLSGANLPRCCAEMLLCNGVGAVAPNLIRLMRMRTVRAQGPITAGSSEARQWQTLGDYMQSLADEHNLLRREY